MGSSRANSLPRPTSPSPSVASEKTEVDLQEKQEREEEERKRRIQLYVFISRCIAYPFNAKQPTDMTRRQTKITKHQLESIVNRFQVSFSSSRHTYNAKQTANNNRFFKSLYDQHTSLKIVCGLSFMTFALCSL